MLITFTLPCFEVLSSPPHKSQSYYVTHVVVLSNSEQNTKAGVYTQKYVTFVAYCPCLSVCCLAIVCCLSLVQTPQSMKAMIVMGDDILSPL